MFTSIARARDHGAAIVIAAAIASACGVTSRAWAATYAAHDGASLSAAVAAANSRSGPSTINLSAGPYTPNATLTIRGHLTIAGPTGPGEKIVGSAVVPSESSLFVVSAGAHATFVDVAVTNAGYPGLAAAIDVSGTIEVVSSTLAGNAGPAMTVEPGASAIVRNSTISDGLAAGIVDNGSATLVNSTVAANAVEGIDRLSGTLRLVNSIVAGNGSADCSAPAQSSDHSLDGDGSCGVGALSRADPKLGRLQAGGGGPTPTRALLPGSAAVDAANQAQCPSEDQRHYPRSDGRCDIGAYEAGARPVGGTAPVSGAPGTGTVSRGRLVGVSGHGWVRGAGSSRITFSVHGRVIRPHGSFAYHDAARKVWLKATRLGSVTIDPLRRVATIKGTATDRLRRGRVSFTATLTDRPGHRSLQVRLSSGYAGGGLLVGGDIALIAAAPVHAAVIDLCTSGVRPVNKRASRGAGRQMHVEGRAGSSRG